MINLFKYILLSFLIFIPLILIMWSINREREKEDFVNNLYKEQCKYCIHQNVYGNMCEHKKHILDVLLHSTDYQIENSCRKYKQLKWLKCGDVCE